MSTTLDTRRPAAACTLPLPALPALHHQHARPFPLCFPSLPMLPCPSTFIHPTASNTCPTSAPLLHTSFRVQLPRHPLPHPAGRDAHHDLRRLQAHDLLLQDRGAAAHCRHARGNQGVGRGGQGGCWWGAGGGMGSVQGLGTASPPSSKPRLQMQVPWLLAAKLGKRNTLWRRLCRSFGAVQLPPTRLPLGPAPPPWLPACPLARRRTASAWAP